MLAAMESPVLREQLVRIVCAWRRLDRSDGEDAVQDAYLCALRTKSPWDGRSTLKTWLTRIVINALNMRARKRKNLEKYETVLDDAFEISDDGFSAHDRVVAMERMELFEDVLLVEMCPFKRQAILLCVANSEDGYREIGEKVGVGVSTLKTRIYRARRELRAVL